MGRDFKIKTKKSFYGVWASNNASKVLVDYDQARIYERTKKSMNHKVRLKGFATEMEAKLWFVQQDSLYAPYAPSTQSRAYSIAKSRTLQDLNLPPFPQRAVKLIPPPLVVRPPVLQAPPAYQSSELIYGTNTKDRAAVVHADLEQQRQVRIANADGGAKQFCFVYSDASKYIDKNARVGVWSPTLRFTDSVELEDGANHQTGEMTGVYMALEKFNSIVIAYGKQATYEALHCFTDSDWAFKTVTVFIHGWIKKFGENGNWITASKTPVKNQPLIRSILIMQRKIEAAGVKVFYHFIPREMNSVADRLSKGENVDLNDYGTPY